MSAAAADPGTFRVARDRAGLLSAVVGARLLGRAVPLSLGWELTTACNGSCTYCAMRQPDPAELSPSEALALVDQMGRAGTRMVSLSGGEPLLRRDLPAIVAALRARGITPSLNSNGFLLPRHVGILRQMARIEISLDGPAELHDAVRGPGSFDKATRAIELCRTEGVPVTVEAVVSRTSLPGLPELLAWCAARSLRIQLQPADPLVLATDRPNPEAPDGAAFAAALRAVRSSAHRSLLLNSSAGLDHLSAFPAPRPMACASSRVSARISSDGTLRLCGVAPAHAPTASWRTHGLLGAFARLHPVACDRCWCAPRVDLNLGFQGRNLGAFVRGRAAGVLPGTR